MEFDKDGYMIPAGTKPPAEKPAEKPVEKPAEKPVVIKVSANVKETPAPAKKLVKIINEKVKTGEKVIPKKGGKKKWR